MILRAIFIACSTLVMLHWWLFDVIPNYRLALVWSSPLPIAWLTSIGSIILWSNKPFTRRERSLRAVELFLFLHVLVVSCLGAVSI